MHVNINMIGRFSSQYDAGNEKPTKKKTEDEPVYYQLLSQIFFDITVFGFKFQLLFSFMSLLHEMHLFFSYRFFT